MRALKAYIRKWLLVIAAGSMAAPCAAQSNVTYWPPTQGTSVSPLASPFFTGQWTVNGSLCASGQLVQGGSPTTCAATLTGALTWSGAQTYKSDSYWHTYRMGSSTNLLGQMGAAGWGDGYGLFFYGWDQSATPTSPALVAQGYANVVSTWPAMALAFQNTNGNPLSMAGQGLWICNNSGITPCDNPLWKMTGNGSVTHYVYGTGGSFTGIGVTTTPGYTLQNLLPAAAGAQQYSPGFSLIGNGWKTDATAASQAVEVRQEVRPVQGTAAPTYTYALMGRVNAGTWGDLFTVSSTGTGRALKFDTADSHSGEVDSPFFDLLDRTKTYQAFGFYGVGEAGWIGASDGNKGGLKLQSQAQDHTSPNLVLASVSGGGYGNTHVPFTLLQNTYWFGGNEKPSKFFSICKYEGNNTYCDTLRISSEALITGGPFAPNVDDGAVDIFGSGATVIRLRGAGGDGDIGTSELPGLVLQNPIATRVGGASTVEYAPSLDFEGSAQNTTSALTELDSWRLTNRPVSVAGTTTSIFCQRSSINNSSFTDRFCVTSAGVGTLATMNATAGQQLNGVLTASATAPTIASGGCSSPAVTWANGTESFLLTIGSSCTGIKTITLTMPAAAHFWQISCDNNTSDARQQASMLVNRSTSTTAAVLTHYARTTGLQADFTASDTFLCSAHGG